MKYCCLKICFSIARRNEMVTNAGYWVLSENRKTELIPSKNSQSVQIAKISSRNAQKIVNQQK